MTLLISSSGAKTAFEVDSSTELAPIHCIVKKGDPRFLREVVKAVEGTADYQVIIDNAKYTQFELYGTPYMGHLLRLVEIWAKIRDRTS